MLSIMNEIDPCMSLPLCVLYGIQNQIYQHLKSLNLVRVKYILKYLRRMRDYMFFHQGEDLMVTSCINTDL